MARSAKIYDFTIQPGGSFTLLVEGSFYRIQEATGALEVRRDGGSGVGPIYPGQGEREEEFQRLTLVDKSGAINKGFIVISDGSFVDDRVTGSVEVIDGGRARTSANLAFIGGVSIQPGAANYAVVQLWNPLGTKKNVVIKKIIGQVAGADSLGFYIQAASIGGAVSAPTSKLGGGGASIAEVRRIGLPTPAMPGFLFGVAVPASGYFDHEFSEPVVLPPGYGLVAINSTLNNAAGLACEYYEEPIL